MGEVSQGPGDGLRFSVLGPLQVARGGTVIPLGGLQQRAVLATLLIHYPATMSVHEIADDVWSGRPLGGYATTVQTYVHRLRALLDPSRHDDGNRAWRILVRSNGGYRLAVDEGSIDATRFRRHVRDGHARLEAGDFTGGHDELTLAESLWRGKPLADLADYPFVCVWAAHLEELRLSAVEDDIEALLAAGGHQIAVGRLDELVQQHPLRERLQSRRMLALYRCGRQADALEAYRTLHRQLAADLGVEPSPDVREVHRRILNQDPGLALAAPPAVRGSPDEAVKPSLSAPAAAVAGPRSVGRRRRRLVSLGATVAMLAASVVAVLAATRGGTAGVAKVPGNAVSSIGPDGALHAGPSIGADPSAMAYGAGSIWVTSTSTGQVSRIDPHTRQVIDRIPVGRFPTAITIAAGSAWVVNNGDGTVSRIDVTTDEVMQTVQVGSLPLAIAPATDGVWVADSGDNAIQHISAATGAAGAPVDVGGRPDGLVVTANAIWVANAADGMLTEIDPKSGQALTGAVSVGSGPRALAYSANAVWVANEASQSVDRIDPVTGRTVAHILVGDGPTALALHSGRVWVANRYDGTISVIDTHTNTVTHRYSIGASPRGLLGVGDSVWIASGPLGGTAHLGGTVVTSVGFSTPGVAVGVDPAKQFEQQATSRATRLVYDGLVAYRVGGGASGLELVPDLAEAVPRPTDGGRTYVFTVRSGIRFSDGTTVKASDIARGVRRALTVTQDSPLHTAGLLGAASCRRYPARCDLHRAVLVDDTQRSIVFHLQAPDPNFLFKLLYASEATPAGAPAGESAVPLPGTGPYRISRYVQGRAFVLKRNAYFRQWSYAAQPAGFPDTIRWVVLPQNGAAGGDPAPGRIDVTSLGPSGTAAASVRARFPARVHSESIFGTQWAYLNTSTPPFNDINVRRALNYAIDRRIVAALMGGLSQPTCQLLPPNFPGYAPHCPYSTGAPQRTYAGPDLARARLLTAAAPSRGMKITLLCRSIAAPRQLWSYIASVLRSLGYHATIKAMQDDEYFTHLVDGPFLNNRTGHPSPWQIISGPGWLADFPAASNFYTNAFGCDVKFAPGHFCNRNIEAQARSATLAEGTDPSRARQLWRAIDKSLTDQAAFLPLVNNFESWLVSERVSNFQSSPFLGPLLDQIWVR